MKVLLAFFRLVRSLNLLFIILTQYLFQYFIVVPIFDRSNASLVISDLNFALLCVSSVLIAAAGYIINDYFDLNIDRVNKPEKMVVDKYIKRRWAIIWHWILSLLGIMVGFYVGYKEDVFWLGFSNIACVAALWFYSTTFKKKLLSGNMIISVLTAWVVLVIGLITDYKIIASNGAYAGVDGAKVLRFTFLYAGFAFIISLIREVIKDIEDMEGDLRYGCKTMPIVWGVHVSKVFAGTWLLVLLGALFVVEVYVLQLGWWIPALYCLVLITVPLLIILRKLKRAIAHQDFHKLSSWVKFVMFTGILSMIFFRMY
jgi:4-hydroxybenzoate polyprenyltransferase